MQTKGNIARYLTHPQVLIDADKEVQTWSLNDVGRSRVAHLAHHPKELQFTMRIITSSETKAIETAEPLADVLGLNLEIRPEMHENDRSATGFLPPEEFETVADQFFAKAEKSVRGWERAVDAQTRILQAVMACLSEHQQGDILFVGHGGVGTLLYCALLKLPINRKFDQGPGGGGNWFAFSLDDLTPLHDWRLMEDLVRP